ncbi:hypothetical protein INT47_006077 [Mucor saturninus]|uniref:Uncharacterized protein n=1 Tax=Mucor saturninus TaxID=64648 RepID=A0A8H7V7C0_9FUNG|nr:hypothetical protein INT47_006077 [Mucor saturninus]
MLYDNPKSQYKLGMMYKEGYGVVQDYSKALSWLTKALENGQEIATLLIGLIYYHGGTGVDRNYTKALHWFLEANNFILYEDKSTIRYSASVQYFTALIYQKGYCTSVDYSLALEWFMKAAANGKKSAMYEIGMMYLNGEGVRKQDDLACQWLTRSAELGYLSAQLCLGIFYYETSISCDYKQAMHWFQNAADVYSHRRKKQLKGCYVAQYYIGIIYLRGHGVYVDYELALQWFAKSAKNGYFLGKFELSLMYFKGQGVPKQEKLAVQWLTDLADLGHVESQVELGCIHLQETLTFCDFETAMGWFQKAANNNNNAQAQFNIGWMYRYGLGVEINHEIAFHWIEKSANQGYSMSQNMLGEMYSNGRGTTQDLNEAVLWFRKSLNNDENAIAQYNLAYCYFTGEGVPINEHTALIFLRKSAAQGYSEAQNELGVMHCEGELVEQNYGKGMMWFRKSIEHEKNSSSLCNIGDLYYGGLGVEKDVSLALSYYTRSAKMGNEDAIRILKQLQCTSDTLVNNDNKDINPHVMKSFKINLHNDAYGSDIMQRIIEGIKSFCVEDRHTVMLETEEESTRFFYIEDPSDAMDDIRKESPKFFYVEDTSKFFHVEDMSATFAERKRKGVQFLDL